MILLFRLSYRDPNLKFGPFKFNHLNTEHFIGVGHDVLNRDKTNNMIKDSKGFAKALYAESNGEDDTSFQVHTSRTEFHSYLKRISMNLR